MTWKDRHTSNKKLIKNYMAYLIDTSSQFSYESRLKLVTEIGRLQLQNQKIEAMPVQDYYKDVYNFTIKTTAQWN